MQNPKLWFKLCPPVETSSSASSPTLPTLLFYDGSVAVLAVASLLRAHWVYMGVSPRCRVSRGLLLYGTRVR